MDPPTERWPVFPTFDQRTLAGLVQDELAERGEHPETIAERREEYARDLLLALDEDIRPPSITTDGARSILQRLSEAAEIDIDHPKHDYLAPHGGRRGMGGYLSARLDTRWRPDISTIQRRWYENAIHISKLASWVMSLQKL
jgi:hypothetical protein